MNLKKSVIAAAVGATLALGASGQASAYVYGAAGLSISNLTISIVPNGGAVDITRFDFNQSNVATLNGNTAVSAATCGGTPAANNCTQTIGRLDAAAVNAPGSTTIRPNNSTTGGDFTFFGPVVAFTGDFANADSQILNAQLVNGVPTQTKNIAESLLNTGTEASGTSQIQSITGFAISFTVGGGPATFNLNFDADPDLAAMIFGESPGTFSAQANLSTSFTLRQNTGGLGFANFAPTGPAATDCVFRGFTSCTEFDSQSLNINVGTTTNNTSDLFSFDPNALNLTPFSLQVTGLTAGTYTLTLAEFKSNQLARTPAAVVPEPGVLALMGIGLMGLFATSRRRKLS
ncbi:MAG: PEP-CTERM sorting domain-containing protein [Casimicrobiaceae bacterium]